MPDPGKLEVIMRQPVIIDTDPGLDDAIAITMALNADNFDVKAVTAVAGNQTLEKTSINALRLVNYYNPEIPVAKGAVKPILRELKTAAHVHGETGLGNVVLPEAKADFASEEAADIIYREAVIAKGMLKIVALGPLTNIAMVLRKYPEIKNLISELVIMGGSCGYGNDTAAAEFNIYCDPEAAKIVFESGLNITMVGLDATHQAIVYPEEMTQIKAIGNKASDLVSQILEYSLPVYNGFGYNGVIMHDPFAMAYAIDPTVMTSEMYHVDVETKGEFTSGKTVADVFRVTGKPANIRVGVGVDREKFVALLKKLLNNCR